MRGLVFMTTEYEEYLNSEEWKKKRQQRLEIAGYRCACCAKASKSNDVHHLTYERIFIEEIADLLPLCRDHHEAAHKLRDAGKLPKVGNVLFLATETVRLILLSEKPEVRGTPKADKRGARNPIQMKLMQDEEFVKMVRHCNRKQFKKWARATYYGGAMNANAFALFQRRSQWLPLIGHGKRPPKVSVKYTQNSESKCGFSPPRKVWDSRSESERLEAFYNR